MADPPLPGLLPNDPENCLSQAARRRVEHAHLKSQLIRTKALAIIETRYRSEPVHELSFAEYFKTGQAVLEWDEAKVESARIVLSAKEREYVAAGKSGRELRQIMNEELEGACSSLELSIPQRDLLSLEIEVNRRILAQTPTPDPVQERTRAGLLGVHSKRLEGAKLEECLREAYDVCARELSGANEPIAEELLSESIPVIVFHAAVEHRWVPYPPVRWIPGGGNMLEGWFRPSRYEPLQQSELTETFGRYKVNPGYTDAFKRHLESRITYWRAEAVRRAADHAFPRANQAGANESRRMEAGPAANAAKSNGKGRKRGPKPDDKGAALVAEIVAQVAPDGDWRSKVDDICEALDVARVPFPRRWWRRDRSCSGWADYDERANAVKAIEYRLEIAKQRKKATPETLS